MFRQDCSHHLLTTILPFWENLTDWERGGWFGYVNHDLSVERGAHKGCILNSRILWTFSTAARVTGDKSLLRYARHAFAFLPHFEDTERGGVYWSVTADGEPLDKTKHTYCQAFAIYGLAAYMRAIGESDPDYIPARCSTSSRRNAATRAATAKPMSRISPPSATRSCPTTRS